MLFNSWSFLFCFLPAWLAIARCAPGHFLSLQPIFLIFSILFYASSSLWSLGLVIGMTWLNYRFGCSIHASSSKRRQTVYLASLIFNILALAWFKYSLFLIQIINLAGNFAIAFTPPVLPLGLSFYTFIQIAWLTAVYKNSLQPGSFSGHALFSCAFPYIAAGPIVRGEQINPQLQELSPPKASNLAPAFSRFTLGLAKKVLLADTLGMYANAVFAAAAKNWPITPAEAWAGSLCYTFQLYFDFSGYTDMALGLALMLGLKLPENFNSPYRATGIIEFWRRWHITLGAWLRDFLYIPLGGSRRGKLKQYRNLFLTMLIGGIWHGAGWTFVVWGALHGAMLCVNHFFRACMNATGLTACLRMAAIKFASMLFTFICLNFCWVVFRADSLDAALNIGSAMFAAAPPVNSASAGFFDSIFPHNYLRDWRPLAFVGFSMIICWFAPNTAQLFALDKSDAPHWRPTRLWAAALAILAFCCLLGLNRNAAFLYFQF